MDENRQATKVVTLTEIAETFRPSDVPENADSWGKLTQDDVVGVLTITVTWSWDLDEA